MKWSLHTALELILGGADAIAQRGIAILDYRDTDTFRDLWFKGLKVEIGVIGGQPVDWADAGKQLVVIGNDPPDGVFDINIPALAGINFRSHFTATSWLAAWKVKFPKAKVSIAVIDPRKSRHANGAVRSLQAILAAKDSDGQSLVPGAAVLNAPSLEGICHWLASVKDDTRALAEEGPHLRELLKSTIWNELTSDREQHHALSNVLGSFLLSNQVGKGEGHAGEPWVQDYLLELVRALGVDADLEQLRLEEEHQGFQRWLTSEQQEAMAGALLIDDMASLWEYFLRGATGFTGNARFGDSGRSYRDSFSNCGGRDVEAGIAGLPERLSTFFASRRAHLDAETLAGVPSKLGEDFVLFLDLRLFRAGSAGQPAELSFYQSLAAFGQQLLDSRRSLPWIDEEAREALRVELRQVGDLPTAGFPPPETILPRLLSLLDPSLPIVIFSSTRRTELIEPFRGFGNLITDFHKPVLTGLADDWEASVREMHASFLDAVGRAGAILRVRRLLRPFQKPLLSN